MDAEILHAIWSECKDLSDTQHKLLLALAFHGSPCWPSVRRLAVMIRRKPRQTRTLLYELQELGYISIKVQRGRGKSNLYTINRQQLLPISEKIGSPDYRSKSAIQIASELLREEEKNKEENPEALLLKLGLTRGSVVWIAAMNGHQK
jgi:MarR-like DNA-binding transcriptional regulator SgrR of sgrS sRNA